MKKVAILFCLLAAILSPSLLFASGSVGKVSPDHLSKRRIEIDAEKMVVQGNGAWWLQEHLAPLMRKRIKETHRAGIAISGRQFRDAAESLDRIHDSGYYSQESRRQVPRGQMVAATDQYQVTAIATVDYKNRGGNFSLGGRNINLSDTKVNVSVRLVVEPIDLRLGLEDQGYEGTGKASRSINRNASLSGYPSYADVNSNSSNIEESMLAEAASAAVDDFLKKFCPEPVTMASSTVSVTGRLTLLTEDGGKIGIQIASDKEVREGSQILFTGSNGQRIAKYYVFKIDDEGVHVRTLLEKVRPTSEQSTIL